MRRRPLLLGMAAIVVVFAPVVGVAAAGAQAQPPITIRVDRADKAGRSPLWIPVRVTVTEGTTGKPYPVDHVVFASARNARGDQAGPFNLGTLELDDPAARGIHEGFVIVPYGGRWTITATVNKASPDPNAPPVVLGRANADMTVDAPGPTPGTGRAAAGGYKPASEPLGVFVLWLHSMVGVGWGIVIAVLALLALPAGRRFLSEYGTTYLDSRLDHIVRAAWWLTGLVVGTGIYNLVKSVAYRVPLSADQARRLFRLPYAEPYYLALAVKLAVYAVMIAATVPLVAEARRRAALAEAGADPGPVVEVDDDRSPWDDPDRPRDSGRVALRRKTVDLRASYRAPERATSRVRGLIVVMAAGGGVILAAVTLLKYFHLLGELSRVAG